jgi:hypothetical protein
LELGAFPGTDELVVVGKEGGVEVGGWHEGLGVVGEGGEDAFDGCKGSRDVKERKDAERKN